METTLPEPLLASTLHGVENVDPSNPNPNKPVASINDTMYQQVSTLRGANDTVVKKHTETITVAENLTRELATAAPFQKVNMTTLEQVEVMAEQAEQVLEEARAQVQESNERVLEQEKINFQTYQTYKRNRNDAVPQVAEAQRKRQKVESGVATLAEAMISTLGDGGNDDERWLEGALQTTEGCKQLLDRQMILMQELKKEKNTVVEEAERLQDQIQPLKSAVQDLRAVSNNQGQGTSNDGKNVMSELNATCAWYENVNRLICAVSGTSVIHRPDAFGDHSLQIKVDSTILTPNKLTASATLEVRFEPKTTNVVFARVIKKKRKTVLFFVQQPHVFSLGFLPFYFPCSFSLARSQRGPVVGYSGVLCCVGRQWIGSFTSCA